ncbi:hypothetical protein OG194_27725 [Streptomyces sp. NBC_01288]|uniref:hypothetical protein n=1 Tax=Streptomyces sp. NBC_01288 TaxID=2903814 RepID=UPI002E11E024|nr:hypothetical protein OG194_27725 [Streptomyces sp. NBC_01288]
MTAPGSPLGFRLIGDQDDAAAETTLRQQGVRFGDPLEREHPGDAQIQPAAHDPKVTAAVTQALAALSPPRTRH